ncbi:MAG: hypothetical protein AB1483_09715 [Candidatus Zixiibacteriota bacterium]
MSGRLKSIIVTVIALAVVTASPVVSAAEFESKILQYKHGRIYFDAGEEQLIFPGSRFTLYRDDDSVYSGRIERAFFGISYSAPTFNFSDSSKIDKLRALIQTADIDSVSTIVLCCRDLTASEMISPVIDSTGALVIRSGKDPLFAARGNSVRIEPVDDYVLTSDLAGMTCDGVLSTEPLPEPFSAPDKVVVHDAPFFAALLPNLSKETNRDAYPSTSLYYRFDVRIMWPAVFGSKTPTPVHRLYAVSGVSPRSYDYDPDKGRQLLSKNHNRPKKITIGVLNSRLQKVAEFFADVLSRDKINVQINQNDTEADLLLTFVPIVWDDPAVSLWYILGLLSTHEPATKAQREALTIAASYVQNSRSAEDAATRFYFCRLADRSLQQDLGVFPLFRPSVYFSPGMNLMEAGFDESGYPNLETLTKLRLPALSEGMAP